MFTLVGLGLGDASDITLKGLEAVHEADIVYLEAYTSFLINSSAEKLAIAYERPVLVADREMVESGEVLQEASEKKVVLLVVGDVFGATTHSDLVVRCHEQGITCRAIHNASIINAVGCCGLQLYRFGQVLSLCFWTETWRPDSWYDRLKSNREMGLHTLLLLDIKVKEISDENLARGRKVYEPSRYMHITEAIDQVLEVEGRKKGGAVAEDGSTMAIGVARVGSDTQQIVAGMMRELRELDFGEPLHSLIIAGDIHTCEAEHVNLFRLNGPVNAHVLLPSNNLDGRTTHHMKKIQGQTKDPQLVPSRDDLKLRCEYCKFQWIHDTLCVRCPAQPTHNKREMWLQPTWMWGKQQPYQYYKYLPAVRNPRTGMPLAREVASGMNNERRGQGLTTKTLNLEKERRGISRAVSNIGRYNTRWQTRFPFPV